MFDKVKQMMEFKRQAEQMKRELEIARLDCNDVRGIKITIDGAQRFHSVEVADELLTAGRKSQLESELLRAVNLAIGRSQAAAAEKMKEMTGFNR